MYKSITILLLLSAHLVFAQKINTDSLHQRLNESISDSLRIEVLNKLALAYWNSEPIKTKEYGDKSIALAQISGNLKQQGLAHYYISISYWTRGLFPKSMKHALTCLKLAEERKDTFRIYATRNLVGLIHLNQDRSREALDYFLPEYEFWSQVDSLDEKIRVSNSIGNAYKELELYDSALFYFNEAVKILRIQNDKDNELLLVFNMGTVYQAQNKFSDAKAQFILALKYARELGRKRDIANSLKELGMCYLTLGDLDSAGYYLYKSLPMFEEREDLRGESKIRKNLSRYESEKNRPKKSLLHLERYTLLNDSIFSEEQTIEIEKLKSSYEIEKRDKEIEVKAQQIESLEKEKEIESLQKNIISIIVFAVFLIGVFVLITLKVRHSRKQKVNRTKLDLQELEWKTEKLKEEQLKEDILVRNDELKVFTQNYAIKSKFVEGVKREIEKIKKAESQDVIMDLTGLQKVLNNHSNLEKDWQDFKVYFEKVHSGFFDNLTGKVAGLSSAEIKLCALLKMDLNIKEMADIMAISPDSVKTARHRLRKKLSLEAEESLHEHLSNF
ncbi:MAG: tetratricopeptide repeat protein [Reichenbachiella sp.]